MNWAIFAQLLGMGGGGAAPSPPAVDSGTYARMDVSETAYNRTAASETTYPRTGASETVYARP